MNEDSWDRLLKSVPQGGMIQAQISTNTPMSPRLIRYWKGLETAERSERKTQSLIMAAEKEGWIFSYPIRQDAGLLGLNTMSGFTRRLFGIRKKQFLPGRYLLYSRMRQFIRFRHRWTDAFSLIRSVWKSLNRQWQE